MRILFAGSPEIALPSLEALVLLSLAGECELAGILTNTDAPRGRHGRPEPTDVGAAAAALPARFAAAGKKPPALLKPERLGPEARAAAAAMEPDILVSFAYGRIFGPKFLGLFPRGGINIHPSLLPKYRGPAPIPAAILGRETETGISIQRLALEMDAGDILVRERIPLSGRETAGGLAKTAGERGAALLPGLIRSLIRGDVPGEPQNHAEASYSSLLSRDDGRIDWALSALEIDARVRAFNPWPLCLTKHGDLDLYILEGRPYPGAGTEPAETSAPPSALPSAPPGTVLGVDKTAGILIQTGDGVFSAERLQYRTRKALEWRAFLNGAKNFTGSHLR
jgi:methionyl-tRNA formyltransferase